MKKNYILTVCLSLIFSAASFGQYSDLFISMYAEGSSNNKALEVYNNTGLTIDLSEYKLGLYSNGSATIGNNITSFMRQEPFHIIDLYIAAILICYVIYLPYYFRDRSEG